MSLIEKEKGLRTKLDALNLVSCIDVFSNESILSVEGYVLAYSKHEQQCFIRYKDTRRSRVSLCLIKHTLRMF
jgi:hypothetical protein